MVAANGSLPSRPRPAANPLDLKSDLALWTAVVFVVLLAVLWKFAWKPIAEGLDKREQHIADQIAEAERNNQDARQLLADYQQKLAASQGRSAASSSRAGARPSSSAGRCSPRPGRRRRRSSSGRCSRSRRPRPAPAGVGRAQRDPGRRTGRQDRPPPARPGDHAQLIQEAVAEFAADNKG